MNVELTMQHMYDTYPGLFKERADCLDHLFCGIGNGYDWVDGELVYYDLSEDEIKTLETNLVDGKAFQHNKLSLRAESRMYERERIANGWYEEYKERYPDEDIEHLKTVRQKTLEKLPDDIYYKEPERKKRWYFYVNIPGREHIDFHERFAYLFNYPENIKPDWFEAINECRQMLIDDGFILPR